MSHVRVEGSEWYVASVSSLRVRLARLAHRGLCVTIQIAQLQTMLSSEQLTPHGGLLSLTSTDTSALYAHYPQAAQPAPSCV